ncbi:sigma-54-dependent Fis family transcriptional regulator [Candidatus Poribacteria bacterium]|nr:sigma-54-dependent Fis family transcriptional regulator [Candidatus Poribacteria bacterium]
MALQNEFETNHSFGEIIGKNKKMQHLFTQIQIAAAGDITVLIQGETGTGKELIAKSIHDNSPRKAGPFVVINCTAIPAELIESVLFGHERGAFTGATERRIGMFEQANTGTLFFDEIGDMPLTLQTKLLRVLQEREFQRIGGTSNISIDIRVLAATNRDLQISIQQAFFRPDLYHRLSAFPITVPPLRDRREDIPILAYHFLKKYAAATEKPIRDISTDTLQTLMQHDFPGNVRELKNAIESAVLFETTDQLQPQSLPSHLTQGDSQVATSSPRDTTVILPLDEVERRAIVHALKVTDNNIPDAARALGIGRSTLYRKLKEYNLLL